MATPKSVNAYPECEEIFAKALGKPNGLGVTLEDPGMATRFKQKMNSYRVLLRRQSTRVHEPDDPRYGTSPYDALQLTTDPDNPARILIKPYRINTVLIEDLPPE